MGEPEIVIEHRAELHYLLTEAAEIEHGLMCCYLYAAYSLKEDMTDLSLEEARAVGAFRSTILDVAREEMVHLALVANLLSAVGAAPHWQRPNFPVSPGYHPAGVVVSLAPFDQATLAHFLYLERPEGVTIPDGAGFSPTHNYERHGQSGRLVPTAQDYQTVGHLYRGIRHGLVGLAQKYGESTLFCGNPRVQVGRDVLQLDGLSQVTDLATALAAIDTIVTQGEGSPAHHETSHYQRFLALDRDLATLLQQNPAFCPARPVARNPVMRQPPQPEGRVWITREPAASLLDLGNAVYAYMLRALDVLFSQPADAPNVRDMLVDTAVLPMRALAEIAAYLPALPATADDRGPRAGLTFTISRSQHSTPDLGRAMALLAEDAAAIVDTYNAVAIPLDGRFARGRDAMKRVGEGLTALASAAALIPAAAAQTASAEPVSVADPAATPMGPAVDASSPANAIAPDSVSDAPALATTPGIEVVRGQRIVIQFEAKRCIHARHCVLETPEVFLANVKGPWIHPDDAPIDRLVHVARTCPSGAITYERLDGGEQEDAPPVNLLRVRERGPLAVHAELLIDGQPPCHRATLCRCGASQNKPFCDGSHARAGFDATGEPVTSAGDALAIRGGPLRVTPLENGPLRVRGPLELLSGTGRTLARLTQTALCRCGSSANKPYCDGTHARIRFEARGAG